MKNKVKIISFFLAIVCVAAIAYGCGKSDSNTEITDFTLITTITASAAEISDVNFSFESVYSIGDFTIYRETSTDALFVKNDYYRSISGRGSGVGVGVALTQFLDPETGKPLTYAVWLEKYAK